MKDFQMLCSRINLEIALFYFKICQEKNLQTPQQKERKCNKVITFMKSKTRISFLGKGTEQQAMSERNYWEWISLYRIFLI